MMPWVKLDDRFFTNPKVLRAGRDARDLYLAGLCYCASGLTDGFVPTEAVPLLAVQTGIALGPDIEVAVTRLVEGRLWMATEGGYEVHDYLEYNPTAEEVRREREAGAIRKQLYADPFLIQRVKQRDHNLCRFCGVMVNWNDRRGPRGGTIDHLKPLKPRTRSELVPIYNAEDNLVVACRYCNTSKGNRTPDEAGMAVLPPGTPQEKSDGNQVGTSSNPGRNQNGTKRDLSHIPSRPIDESLSPTEREGPGAGAPAPSARKQQRRLPLEASPTTKPVQLANAILHLRCDETQREAINAAVPDTEEGAARWQTVLKQWRLRYPNNRGLQGPLDWFAVGVPESRQNGPTAQPPKSAAGREMAELRAEGVIDEHGNFV